MLISDCYKDTDIRLRFGVPAELVDMLNAVDVHVPEPTSRNPGDVVIAVTVDYVADTDPCDDVLTYADLGLEPPESPA